ncbi:unnamed protein product [Eruca vesicaria subsp. sativa]|uniref:Uncharacterized protein n=1 Tax=Eruca vesicaria subsp. sativa TaxID=29727 RepID=A0ABC8JVB8_ERUVS|nr:unnamed protein product [Eruca vesicaria subsp. sativa]
MLGLVLGTMILGSIHMFIDRPRANGQERMRKHKQGGSIIIAACIILLLFLPQTLGEGICPAGRASIFRNEIRCVVQEFNPFKADDDYY